MENNHNDAAYCDRFKYPKIVSFFLTIKNGTIYLNSKK